MKPKKGIWGVLLCFLFFVGHSQNRSVDSLLNHWSEITSIQKLYVQTDRDTYFAGDTIWAKGYFMSMFEPSIANTTLFIELTDPEKGVLITNVFPVYYSLATGQLILPDSLGSGSYLLRAYAPLMMNQPLFTFRKIINVVGKGERSASNTVQAGSLRFFPEGGNLLAGTENKVAFKATDQMGFPKEVKGYIKNSIGDTVTSIQSIHDGMGVFNIIPNSGELYYAIIDGQSGRYPLPETADEGTGIEVTEADGGKRFRVFSTAVSEERKPALLIGQMQGRIVFRQNLNLENGREFRGTIKTGELYSGILHLTVFNRDNMPLAERLTFIDNKEYALEGRLQTDTLNTGNRGYNHFRLSFGDSLIGDFSVSVTDADMDYPLPYTGNIWSWFMLGSDLSGYIYNPSFYFDSQNKDAGRYLDLVMMTNGWTRFKWKELSSKKHSTVTFNDPGYITLSGKITSGNEKKNFADKDLLLFMTRDSLRLGRNSLLIRTSADGKFSVDSLIFFDKNFFLFSDIKGNKSQTIKARFDKGDIFGGPYPPLMQLWPGAGAVNRTPLQWFQRSGIGINDKDLLPEITIKGKYRTTLEKLDDDYATGMFKGNFFNRVLDIRKESPSGNIFQYLQERIPGLRISGGPGSYRLNYRGGNLRYYTDGEPQDDPTGAVEDNSNVTVFLDEMPSNTLMLETIPLNQIAMVKLIPFSPMVAGGGTALAVYLKKGSDLNPGSVSNGTSVAEYYGYTIIKEFYNPDYTHNQRIERPDQRITLNWVSGYAVSPSNPEIQISFFNNDRTRRFRIIAEGVSADGRLLHFEKIVE